MKILISNDDGIQAPGINALTEAMMDLGDVTVVAPDRERSTSSHSLTLSKPLRVHEVGPKRFSTSGSPADCIFLGLRHVLKEKPDVIITGINSGANVGTDVHYSGTVAAAREGALVNIPSYAFSLADISQMNPSFCSEPFRFSMAAQLAKKIVEMTWKVGFPSHSLLNVNIPNIPIDSIKGIQVTEQGIRYYSSELTQRTDPRGKEYFWIGGVIAGFEQREGTDCQALSQGWVTVTPVTIDSTHRDFIDRLRSAGLGRTEL